MLEKERYYSMGAGVEARKAAAAYSYAYDVRNLQVKAITLKAKTKSLIAQNPESAFQREKTELRRRRFPTGLSVDFWN